MASTAARRDASRPCIDGGVPLIHRVTRLPGRRSSEFIRWVRYRHGERRDSPASIFCASAHTAADTPTPDHMLTQIDPSLIMAAACGPGRILVVDDDPAVRHLISDYFGEHG